jgi:hypothetical protein
MRFASRIGAFALALSFAGTAQATVTVYTSQSAFSAATTVTNNATFDGVPTGRLSSPVFSQDGVQITTLPGGHPTHTLYIVPSGSALVTPAPTSAVLSSDGDENYDIRLTSGNTFGSIGFDVYSNAYAPRTVSLYAMGGGLIGTYTATQPANSLGFFGLVSTTAVAYITTTVDRGWVQNTGIDNVQIGALAAVPGAVPESSVWTMMIIGFGVLGASLRRRSGRMVSRLT